MEKRMEKSNRLSGISGFFLDSSKLEEIKKWSSVIKGITTNPMILQKDGVVNIPEHLHKICFLVGDNFPVSVEIPYSKMSDSDMYSLADKYHAKYPSNAVIKIPIFPDGRSFWMIRNMIKKGITVNATVGISFAQLALAAEAGAQYISLFWGRSEESKSKYQEGPGAQETLISLLNYIRNQNLNNVRVIIGSVRSSEQIRIAFSLGAHIVTVTSEVLQKSLESKRLTETLNQFDQAYLDAKKDRSFKLI